MNEDEWLDCERLNSLETLSQSSKTITSCYLGIKRIFNADLCWSKLEYIELDNEMCRECFRIYDGELLPKQIKSSNFPRLVGHDIKDICTIKLSLVLKKLISANQAKIRSMTTLYLCLLSFRMFDKNVIKLICNQIKDWPVPAEIEEESFYIRVESRNKKRQKSDLQEQLDIVNGRRNQLKKEIFQINRELGEINKKI